MVSRILGFEKELQFTGTDPDILPEGPVSIFFKHPNFTMVLAANYITNI